MTALAVAGAGFFAAPVYAQEVPPAGATVPTPTTPSDDTSQDIVVTGSILRGADSGISPVTTLTAENLDARGINTVQDAIQLLSSNNGPALTNSFTANGAFAGGASAVSLRGLSTSSTLVLFDGLRAAYYPLADDGSRNFVDLNTIPDDIVDRVEVLRDGASSAYGADAIAGVVNIITKRSVKGVSGRVEAGISERGFAANQRLTLTAGTGDLDQQGYNAYISGFYFRSEGVKNRELPGVFGTDDQRSIGGPNGIFNGQNAQGNLNGFNVGSTFYVRPGTTGRYQILNAANGCYAGPSITPNAASLAASATLPTSNVCQEDFTYNYGNVTPDIERFGGSARFTAKIGDLVGSVSVGQFPADHVELLWQHRYDPRQCPDRHPVPAVLDLVGSGDLRAGFGDPDAAGLCLRRARELHRRQWPPEPEQPVRGTGADGADPRP
ncbi:TonB-dependent receptor plug domain-containing protein [Sphingomonas panni]